MPRVSDEHKAQRRGEILDAARVCFARSGFQGATLQDVFAEAELSAGAVYNYFRSKHEIVLAIAEERHADERGALRTDGEDDPIAALKLITRRFLSAYLAPGADVKRRVSLMTWSEALVDGDIRASVREGMDEPRAALKAILARGRKAGVIRSGIDPDAMARAMVAMLQGLVLQRLWDDKLDARAMGRVCEELIDGLRT